MPFLLFCLLLSALVTRSKSEVVGIGGVFSVLVDFEYGLLGRVEYRLPESVVRLLLLRLGVRAWRRLAQRVLEGFVLVAVAIGSVRLSEVVEQVGRLGEVVHVDLAFAHRQQELLERLARVRERPLLRVRLWCQRARTVP